MFYQIFVSSQVKRWAIIFYKDSIHELLHELWNDLTLAISENKEMPQQCLHFIECQPSAHSSCQNKSFINTGKKVTKNGD